MTTNLTVLPTRVDGSLGRLKTDPKSAIALDHQVQAVEYETMADWVKELAEVQGPQAVYDRDTVRALLDPNFLQFKEPFIGVQGAILRDPWATIAGADWHYTGLVIGRNGAYGTLDAVDTAVHSVVTHRLRTPRLRFSQMVDDDPGTGTFVSLRSSVLNTGIGVEFLGAAKAINAYRYSGGIVVATENLGTWVGSTYYSFDIRITPTFQCLVSMDGGADEDLGVIDASSLLLMMETSADGAAGKLTIVRNMLLTANETP